MKKLLLSAYLLLIFSFFVHAQIITTLAGTGTYGYSGDGGPAVNAQLAEMYYCYPAIDNAGNVYFAQNLSNTIRKIDKNGIITTIAGTKDIAGYTGDGGPATNALLYHPTALAIDASNNLYISDRNGGVIRKIDGNGIITTISGQYAISCGVGDGGPLINAQFEAISALYVDASGILFISDYGCNTIRKVNSNGIISTIAGSGAYGFSGDNGPATSAKLAYPCSVTTDKAGNVYFADAQNQRIRKVDAAGIITTVAGNGINGYSGDGGNAKSAALSFPGSVVIDRAGNLYYGDAKQVIRKIDVSGIITTYAGTGKGGYSGDGGPAILADLVITQGRISIDKNDDIYFCGEASYSIVRKITNCALGVFSQSPQSVSICNNSNANFTVSLNNNYQYQWQVKSSGNWANVADGNFYSGSQTNTLKISGANFSLNGNQYRCIIGNNCASIITLPAILTVQSSLPAAIAITSSLDSACSGTTVQFQSTVTSAVGFPTYQWKKNGIPVGTNSNTYNDGSLKNGDTVICILTYTSNCVPLSAVVSNPVSVKISNPVTPSITISSLTNKICDGTRVNFTASATNGGITATYQWLKNGVNTGINSPNYSDSMLKNNDVISCKLTSSLFCTTGTSAVSNSIRIIVDSLISPTINISTSSESICAGKSLVFKATSTPTNMNSSYQWMKNNKPVGADRDQYSDGSLNDGDKISCQLTISAKCATLSSVTSNTITMTVFKNPQVALDHSNDICLGSSKKLDAGNFAYYLWNDGSNGRYLSVYNAGTYIVRVKDNNGCEGSDTVVIRNLLNRPRDFLPADTAICSYGFLTLKSTNIYSSYLWNNNSNNNSITITKPGIYWLEVIDANNCVGRDSITVKDKQCIEGFFIPNGFSPNHDGRNDNYKPIIFGNVKFYEFSIYNRFGEVVFKTSELNKGWDGYTKGRPSDSNIYVWMCKYQFALGDVKFEKGTVMIMR